MDEAPKADRAEVFAAWLDEAGRERLTTVVDVAGGKGAVAAALLRRGASGKATVIDPWAWIETTQARPNKQASTTPFRSGAMPQEPFAYPTIIKTKGTTSRSHVSSRCTPTRRRSRRLRRGFSWDALCRRAMLYFCLEVSAPAPVLEVRPGASERV